jgi:hypothetical protein
VTLAISPLLFNVALEHAIRKVQKNQVCLKLNGTHQLLVYADDVNLLGDKEFGLEVNAEKTKLYLAVSSPECRAES